MKNDDKTLGLLLARTLSGCFTVFTPARDFCTRDPENTLMLLCTPEEMKASTDWQNKINKGVNC